ncbi:MAG: flagellar hook-length control protein FliK [Oscillospiraceae bacterium]
MTTNQITASNSDVSALLQLYAQGGTTATGTQNAFLQLIAQLTGQTADATDTTGTAGTADTTTSDTTDTAQLEALLGLLNTSMLAGTVLDGFTQADSLTTDDSSSQSLLTTDTTAQSLLAAMAQSGTTDAQSLLGSLIGESDPQSLLGSITGTSGLYGNQTGTSGLYGSMTETTQSDGLYALLAENGVTPEIARALSASGGISLLAGNSGAFATGTAANSLYQAFANAASQTAQANATAGTTDEQIVTGQIISAKAVPPAAQSQADTANAFTANTAQNSAQSKPLSAAAPSTQIAQSAHSAQPQSATEQNALEILRGQAYFLSAVRIAKEAPKQETPDGTTSADTAAAIQQAASAPVQPDDVSDTAQANSVLTQTADAIQTQLSKAEAAGKEQFTIKLKPEGLGEITVKIEKSADGMVLNLMASSAKTAALIDSQLTALQSAVSHLGAQVTNTRPEAVLSGSDQYAFQQDTAGNGFRQSQQHSGNRNAAYQTAQDTGETAQTTQTLVQTAGLLRYA